MNQGDMEGLRHTAKIKEYCDYIDEHLRNVAQAWNIVQEKCSDLNVISDDHLFFCIDTMIKAHDLSKISTEEFVPYQRKFFPADGKDDSGFGVAWEHHLGQNPHHWEKWTKTQEHYSNELACHCVCMFCDWMAMGMKFDDTAQEYFEANESEIELPEWAVVFLNEMFERVYPNDAASIKGVEGIDA